MSGPRSEEEFIKLLDDIIFDVEEVIASAEYEGDTITDLTDLLPIYEQIGEHLRRLMVSVKSGEHEFGSGKDLPIMEAVVKWRLKIPFAHALSVLNDVQKKSLDDQ